MMVHCLTSIFARQIASRIAHHPDLVLFPASIFVVTGERRSAASHPFSEGDEW
jgi:hypothetical protein